MRRAARLAAAAAALAVCAGCSGGSRPGGAAETAVAPLRAEGGWFRDPQGRAVILHGVNAVPGPQDFMFAEADYGEPQLDLLERLGFNTARVGYFWGGMVPAAPGDYDEDYFERFIALVERFTARGFYVLVDSHQDSYARALGGRGAPDWAVFTDGLALDGRVAAPLSVFFEPAIWRATESFWANREGVQDAYLDVLQRVADRVKDDPYVLGYDLHNEPFPGGRWLDYGADDRAIGAFYRRAIPALRAADPDAILFWEPALTEWLGAAGTISDLGDANTALSYHVYCLWTVLGVFSRAGAYDTEACRAWSEPKFLEKRGQRDANGSAWLLTEWGWQHILEDVALHAEIADRLLSGWQYWPDGAPEVFEATLEGNDRPLADVVSRAYARRVAGEPLEMRFDPDSGDFLLRYRPEAAVLAPTEIWVPEARHYPEGYAVEVEGGAWSPGPEPTVIEVRSAPGAAETAVRIRRR